MTYLSSNRWKLESLATVLIQNDLDFMVSAIFVDLEKKMVVLVKNSSERVPFVY